MSGLSRIQHDMKVWQAKGTLRSLELAAASAHLAVCDPGAPNALGSLTLARPPLEMAASSAPSASEQALWDAWNAGGTGAGLGGPQADRSMPPGGAAGTGGPQAD
eukprot:13312043-Alexandrium_andersonii.AAC.1